MTTTDDDNAVPIRDAACIVLTDTSDGEPRLLLGKRRATQVFLPNMWVFPGGRVDDEDRVLASTLDLPEGLPGRAARVPFVVAAVRELYEEAGLLLGTDDQHSELAAGANGTARALSADRMRQACSILKPLARAITPPGRPRRFDTWFFLTCRTLTGETKAPDGELLDLGWFTLNEARGLDLPTITRFIVEDVASSLKRGPSASEGPFPFYYQGPSSYERRLISDDAHPAPALTPDSG